MSSTSRPGAFRASAGLWLAAPLAVGTALRLWNLPAQILGGDEMHAVRAALGSRLPEILVTYRQADNCIPLTAIYRLVLDAGGSLTEMVLRLPVLLAGILLAALAPLWIDRRVGRRTAVVFAWLLAVSPAAVLYSRIARSYMPMLLLGGGAVAAFEAFWRTRRPRWAVAYVALGALALWFHLGSGPFVAAPLLFAAGDLLLARRGGHVEGRQDDRDMRPGALLALGATALGLAAACALFLLPARETLAGLIATKRQAQSIPLRTVLDVMLLQAGTGMSGVAALFWGLAVGGLALLTARRPRFGLYALTIAFGQIVGILILSPIGLAHPWILNRYLVPVLPWLLLGVAYALAEGGWPAREEAGAPEGAHEGEIPEEDAEQPAGPAEEGGDAGLDRQAGEAANRAAGDFRTRAAVDFRTRTAVDFRTRTASRLRGTAAAVFVALLVLTGPFADANFRASSFMHHDDMAGFYLPRATVPTGAVPGFYRNLAAGRGAAGKVVEYPWLFLWRFRSFYVYQEIHHRPVLVATGQRLARRPGLSLSNAVVAEPGPLCASGARYFVVHQHVAREEDRVVRPEDKPAPALTRDLRRDLRQEAARMTRRLRGLWGEPVYADGDVHVWDLACSCRGRAR